MNHKRNYLRVWWPAVYVGAGPLHGKRGEAMHIDGDTWRFEYVGEKSRYHSGHVLGVCDVHRTEIDVEAVGCK